MAVPSQSITSCRVTLDPQAHEALYSYKYKSENGMVSDDWLAVSRKYL